MVRPELMEAFACTLDYDIPRPFCRPQLSSLPRYGEPYSIELDLHVLGRALEYAFQLRATQSTTRCLNPESDGRLRETSAYLFK